MSILNDWPPLLHAQPADRHRHLRELHPSHRWYHPLLRLSVATLVRQGTPVVEPTLLATSHRPPGPEQRGERLTCLSPTQLRGRELCLNADDEVLLEAAARYGHQQGLTAALLALSLPALNAAQPRWQPSGTVESSLRASGERLSAQGWINAAQACGNIADLLR